MIFANKKAKTAKNIFDKKAPTTSTPTTDTSATSTSVPTSRFL